MGDQAIINRFGDPLESIYSQGLSWCPEYYNQDVFVRTDRTMNSFRTERLYLRKLTRADAPLIRALNSDAEVMKYIGPPDNSLRNAQDYVDMRVNGYADKDGLGIFVAERLDNQEPIGWFCLKYLDDTDEIEIGYRLLREHWGIGYATEGSKCLLVHGFENLKLKEIVGVTMPANIPSQKVLLKLGLEKAGVARYYGNELLYFRKSNC